MMLGIYFKNYGRQVDRKDGGTAEDLFRVEIKQKWL